MFGPRNIVTKYSVAPQSMDCTRRPSPEPNAVELGGSAFSSHFRHGQDGIDGDIFRRDLRACELQLKQDSNKDEDCMRKSIHGTVNTSTSRFGEVQQSSVASILGPSKSFATRPLLAHTCPGQRPARKGRYPGISGRPSRLTLQRGWPFLEKLSRCGFARRGRSTWKIAWMTLISVPRSSRWVAKQWRSACSVTPFLIPAASAASWNSRLSWRVVIGLPRLWPGNSQRSSTGVPASSRDGRAFHHPRNRSSISAERMTLRSLRPFDCSTRMIFCALSICLTFSRTIPAAPTSWRGASGSTRCKRLFGDILQQNYVAR